MDDLLLYFFVYDDGDVVGLDDGGCGVDLKVVVDGDFGVYDLWGECVWEFDVCVEVVLVF